MLFNSVFRIHSISFGDFNKLIISFGSASLALMVYKTNFIRIRRRHISFIHSLIRAHKQDVGGFLFTFIQTISVSKASDSRFG